MPKTEFRTITLRTKELLKKPEGIDIDFKREPSAIKNHLLVAFANSLNGGTILAGVGEETDNDGVQRGVINGCAVDDRSKQSIINKAQDCNPRVPIEIFTENLNATPFLRIEIPPAHNRPYCTMKGEYKIREDGRVRPLYAEELLAMFMEREGEQFLGRFRSAVEGLEGDVNDIREKVAEAFNDVKLKLASGLDSLETQVSDNHYDTERSLEYINGVAEDATGYASEAAELVAPIYDELSELKLDTNGALEAIEDSISQKYYSLGVCLQAVMENLSISNPLEEEQSRSLRLRAFSYMLNSSSRSSDQFYRLNRTAFPLLGESTVHSIYESVAREVETRLASGENPDEIRLDIIELLNF